MRRRLLLAVLAALAVAAAACGDDDDGAATASPVDGGGDGASPVGPTSTTMAPPATSGPPATAATGAPAADATTTTAEGAGGAATPPPAVTGTPAPTVAPAPVGGVALALEPVATLRSPVAVAADPESDALFVAEQRGVLQRLADGGAEAVLEIPVSTGNEQGLLGVAVAPDGAHLYVDFTDPAGDTHVVEYPLGPDRVPDPGGAREILFVDQPFANHNGGQLAFGPDGHLYIALGDGGSQGDPSGNGQRLDTLLAKILRISPRPSGDQPYGIPPDNPFVGRAGARPEIWALGLRNPWRFGFDRANGELWIGDVGGGLAEEIDWAPAGAGGRNYGWQDMEGTHQIRAPEADVVGPVVNIDHAAEPVCSVIGGFVYRGTAIPALAGTYLYSDFCTGRIDGLRAEGGQIVDGPARVGLDVPQITTFGQDDDGELWVLSRQGAVSRIVPG
jgi:glucose/arabinose dehydrogenase